MLEGYCLFALEAEADLEAAQGCERFPGLHDRLFHNEHSITTLCYEASAVPCWRVTACLPLKRRRMRSKNSGSAPNKAAIVVIRIGRKRSWHASKMASVVDLPCSRSATRAKSIIMIAFFFTMPMSRM